MGGAGSVNFARVVAEELAATVLPAVAGWMAPSADVVEAFRLHAVPFYDDVEYLFRSLRAVIRTRALLGDANHVPVTGVDGGETTPTSTPLQVVTEDELGEWMREAAIDVAAGGVALSQADAVSLAERLGLPVVLKSVSPSVPHRGRVGALALCVATPEAVGSEYNRIVARVVEAGGLSPERVIVQHFVSLAVEAFLGVRVDPRYGSVVSVGLGGSHVEALKDVQFATFPCSKQTAVDLIERAPLLSAVLPPADRVALADLVVVLGRAWPEWVRTHGLRELDLNPVGVSPGGVRVFDALGGRV